MSAINPEGELIVLEDKPQPSDGRRFNWWRLIGYITVLVFTILYLYPLLMLLGTSLKTLPEFFRSPTGLPATHVDPQLGRGQK